MTGISGLGSGADYTTGTQSSSSVASGSGSNTISFSTETISSALGVNSPTVTDADAGDLLSVVDAEVRGSVYLGVSRNLAGVGSAIDKYTSSLSSSNVYDSSYTTPSSQFLSDLADLKTAAASGNFQEAETDLVQGEHDAPMSVGNAEATALAAGDTAGFASLEVEGAANISDNLVWLGCSVAGAQAEASFITINGISESAGNTSSSTSQTLSQEISDLAESTASTPLASKGNPLLSIIESLLAAKLSDTGIDQSLADLDALYGNSSGVRGNASK